MDSSSFLGTLCITLEHPFPQFPQRAHNHFIDVTELCLFCI
jgi:hypothetical protein